MAALPESHPVPQALGRHFVMRRPMHRASEFQLQTCCRRRHWRDGELSTRQLHGTEHPQQRLPPAPPQTSDTWTQGRVCARARRQVRPAQARPSALRRKDLRGLSPNRRSDKATNSRLGKTRPL